MRVYPKKAPLPLPKERQQRAGQSPPTSTRIPTKPGSSRDVQSPPAPQQEGRSHGHVKQKVQPGDHVINPAVPGANVQPTPVFTTRAGTKERKVGLQHEHWTIPRDPYVPPMTMEDSQKYLDGDMFDHDPANLTFQWTTC